MLDFKLQTRKFNTQLQKQKSNPNQVMAPRRNGLLQEGHNAGLKSTDFVLYKLWCNIGCRYLWSWVRGGGRTWPALTSWGSGSRSESAGSALFTVTNYKRLKETVLEIQDYFNPSQLWVFSNVIQGNFYIWFNFYRFKFRINWVTYLRSLDHSLSKDFR
jgi:hypothetical protein